MTPHRLASLLLALALPACADTLPTPRPETGTVAVAAATPGLMPVRRPETTRPESTRTGGQKPVARPAARVAGICGDQRLEGRRLAPIDGPGRCGIAAPVRVRRVAGVALNPPADLDCDAATALADWVADDLQGVASANAGSPLQSMRVAASYVCKTVNSKRGGRLSQHALGNAIDISAFTLSDGRRITVSDGWRGSDSPFTRAAWRSACGPFGTVLGPAADRYHQHHLHMDVAQYSGGPYCR